MYLRACVRMSVLRAQHKTKWDRIFYYKIDYAKDESSSLTSYFAKTSRWFVRDPSLSSYFFVILAIFLSKYSFIVQKKKPIAFFFLFN